MQCSWAPLSCQRWRRGQVDRILLFAQKTSLYSGRGSLGATCCSPLLFYLESLLPSPLFLNPGLVTFCIFVIVDCFDLSIFYHTGKSIYTLASTFGSWDLSPRILNRTNEKHCQILSSSTMVWSSSANIVITNQEARESIKISIFMMPSHLIFVTTITATGG